MAEMISNLGKYTQYLLKACRTIQTIEFPNIFWFFPYEIVFFSVLSNEVFLFVFFTEASLPPVHTAKRLRHFQPQLACLFPTGIYKITNISLHISHYIHEAYSLMHLAVFNLWHPLFWDRQSSLSSNHITLLLLFRFQGVSVYWWYASNTHSY